MSRRAPRRLGLLAIFLLAVCAALYTGWYRYLRQGAPAVMAVEERLVGTWGAELLPLYLELMPGSEPAELEQLLDGVAYREVFHRDGSREQVTVSGDRELVNRGTWESLSSEGDVHQLRLTLREGGGTFDEGQLTFRGEQSFELVFTNGGGQFAGKTVTFSRLPAPPPAPAHRQSE